MIMMFGCEPMIHVQMMDMMELPTDASIERKVQSVLKAIHVLVSAI